MRNILDLFVCATFYFCLFYCANRYQIA